MGRSLALQQHILTARDSGYPYDNMRAVRILLECILVNFEVTFIRIKKLLKNIVYDSFGAGGGYW